jgi:hypothetical protein
MGKPVFEDGSLPALVSRKDANGGVGSWRLSAGSWKLVAGN